MTFVKPKELQETNGNGVVLNLHCFRNDPSEDDDMQPDLYYQVLIPAPNVEAVTADMVEDAIAAARPDIDIQIAPPKQAPASVRSMMSKVFDVDAIADKSAQRRKAKGGTS